MVSVMNVFKKKSFWLIVVALISIITILIGFFIIQNYINNRKAKEKAQIDAKRKAEIEAMEKETKQALEEYVNNCWFYFDDCDAEEIYINTSQTYDFYTKEENFGYWIQILGDDYFGGKTDSWERFQRNISRRREFYSKTITIPDTFIIFLSHKNLPFFNFYFSQKLSQIWENPPKNKIHLPKTGNLSA